MKYFIYVLGVVLITFSADAAHGGRPAMSPRIISAPRYTASVKQIDGMDNGNTVKKTVLVSNKSSVENVEDVTESKEDKVAEEKPVVDMREAERNACINNNIGIGNTFVWASRYSDTSNYANMIEDSEHPENNVCFVRVELKSSNESRIKVSDIEPRYFMWGEPIKCGSWVSKKEMEKRILDARKGARIGGIVASTVAGVGLGIGAMELFGNKLIGGKVQGQKSVSGKTLYKNKLVSMKEKNSPGFSEYKQDLAVMAQACNSTYRGFISNCSLYIELYDAVK